MLDIVLGGDDKKGRRQLVRDAIHADLKLFHALEEAGLRLGGRAVDLVREHDIGKDGSWLENKLPGLLVKDRGAGDVGGQQVRGELDALEGAIQRTRQGARQHGLAGTGDILDEQVPAAEQGDDGPPDRFGLPDDHRLDLIDHVLGHRAHLRQLHAYPPLSRVYGLV